jgi:hypothetical protein
MSLESVRERCTEVTRNARNVKRLVDSDNFTIAYNDATKYMKDRVESAIRYHDKDYLRDFITNSLRKMTPFHSMGVRSLRKIAKNLSITGYWSMDKETLIKEIADVITRLKKSGKQLLFQSKEGVDTE